MQKPFNYIFFLWCLVCPGRGEVFGGNADKEKEKRGREVSEVFPRFSTKEIKKECQKSIELSQMPEMDLRMLSAHKTTTESATMKRQLCLLYCGSHWLALQGSSHPPGPLGIQRGGNFYREQECGRQKKKQRLCKPRWAMMAGNDKCIWFIVYRLWKNKCVRVFASLSCQGESDYSHSTGYKSRNKKKKID